MMDSRMFLWSANLQVESIFEKGGNTWVEKRKARKDKKIIRETFQTMRMIAVELVMMVTIMVTMMVTMMTMMMMMITMIAAELATEV